jgi:hypothetical protein
MSACAQSCLRADGMPACAHACAPTYVRLRACACTCVCVKIYVREGMCACSSTRACVYLCVCVPVRVPVRANVPGPRTGAHRLREGVGRDGRMRVVVEIAGNRVPVAPGRVVRVFVIQPIRLVRGRSRTPACILRIEPHVARRAHSAASVAERERCTPKAPRLPWAQCTQSRTAVWCLRVRSVWLTHTHSGGSKDARGRAWSCMCSSAQSAPRHALCERFAWYRLEGRMSAESPLPPHLPDASKREPATRRRRSQHAARAGCEPGCLCACVHVCADVCVPVRACVRACVEGRASA